MKLNLRNNYFFLLIKLKLKSILVDKYFYVKAFLTIPIVILLPIALMATYLKSSYSIELIVKTEFWSFFYFVVFEVIFVMMKYIYTSKLDEYIFVKIDIWKVTLSESIAAFLLYLPSFLTVLIATFILNNMNISLIYIVTCLICMIISIFAMCLFILSLFTKWKSVFNVINLSMDIIYILVGSMYPVSVFIFPFNIISKLIPFTYVLNMMDSPNALNDGVIFLFLSTVWIVCAMKLINFNIEKYKEQGGLYV